MKNRTLWMFTLCAFLLLGLVCFAVINSQSKATIEQATQADEQYDLVKEPANGAKPEKELTDMTGTVPVTTGEPTATADETEAPTQEETPAPELAQTSEETQTPEETQDAGEDVEIVDGEDGTVVITVPEGMAVGEL